MFYYLAIAFWVFTKLYFSDDFSDFCVMSAVAKEAGEASFMMAKQ